MSANWSVGFSPCVLGIGSVGLSRTTARLSREICIPIFWPVWLASCRDVELNLKTVFWWVGGRGFIERTKPLKSRARVLAERPSKHGSTQHQRADLGASVGQTPQGEPLPIPAAAGLQHLLVHLSKLASAARQLISAGELPESQCWPVVNWSARGSVDSGRSFWALGLPVYVFPVISGPLAPAFRAEHRRQRREPYGCWPHSCGFMWVFWNQSIESSTSTEPSHRAS